MDPVKPPPKWADPFYHTHDHKQLRDVIKRPAMRRPSTYPQANSYWKCISISSLSIRVRRPGKPPLPTRRSLTPRDAS
jgi:hypothetical protein